MKCALDSSVAFKWVVAEALSVQEGGELLTADTRLASLKTTFPFITELSSLINNPACPL
jgi:predicted nucleic acid-binding protein